jgi:hypothetical protein
MEGQVKNTVIITNKVRIDHKFYSLLNILQAKCRLVVTKMLKDRTKKSSKYYKEIPCVVSKSLITKYQKDKKCKQVKRFLFVVIKENK